MIGTADGFLLREPLSTAHHTATGCLTRVAGWTQITLCRSWTSSIFVAVGTGTQQAAWSNALQACRSRLTMPCSGTPLSKPKSRCYCDYFWSTCRSPSAGGMAIPLGPGIIFRLMC